MIAIMAYKRHAGLGVNHFSIPVFFFFSLIFMSDLLFEVDVLGFWGSRVHLEGGSVRERESCQERGFLGLALQTDAFLLLLLLLLLHDIISFSGHLDVDVDVDLGVDVDVICRAEAR